MSFFGFVLTGLNMFCSLCFSLFLKGFRAVVNKKVLH
jgi:hypothetical protein